MVTGNIAKYNKNSIRKPKANILLLGEKFRAILLKSGTRQVYLLSPYLFKIVILILTTAIRQLREIRGIQIGEEEV